MRLHVYCWVRIKYNPNNITIAPFIWFAEAKYVCKKRQRSEGMPVKVLGQTSKSSSISGTTQMLVLFVLSSGTRRCFMTQRQSKTSSITKKDSISVTSNTDVDLLSSPKKCCKSSPKPKKAKETLRAFTFPSD
jgi:hypothetical protein